MHGKQIPIPFPFQIRLYTGKSILRIYKIRCQRTFEVPDILINIFRVLIEMLMVKSIILLGITSVVRKSLKGCQLGYESYR